MNQVRKLPPKAEVLAWSEKTGVEMFKYGDHILGIQGHPEYSRDILLHLVDRLQRCDLILVIRCLATNLFASQVSTSNFKVSVNEHDILSADHCIFICKFAGVLR